MLILNFFNFLYNKCCYGWWLNINSYDSICKYIIFLIFVLATDEAVDKLGKCAISEPTFNEPASSKSTDPTSSSQDPTKRLKNLRKKLREIEMLEEKIKSGVLKNPDKDQKEKMAKKSQIILEIETLEKENNI